MVEQVLAILLLIIVGEYVMSFAVGMVPSPVLICKILDVREKGGGIARGVGVIIVVKHGAAFVVG